MRNPQVSDLVELVTDKRLVDPSQREAYIGLEHIPERAIRIGGAGDTDAIKGICVCFLEGDILFGKLRPNLRKCVRAPVDGLGSTEILVLRPKPGVDPRFAGHVLNSETVFALAEKMTEGTRMPRTSWKSLSNIEVFAPEGNHAQGLISDILEVIDDAIVETDAAIRKLHTLRIGVVDDLLLRGLGHNGKPRSLEELEPSEVGRRPTSWVIAPLGRFVVRAEYGTNVPLSDVSDGLPVLRMNNIQEGEFDLSDMRYAPTTVVKRFRLQPSDVLFNRTNSWEHVGKAAIWRRKVCGPAFASYLVRLHCNKGFLPEFLHLWLNWAPVQRGMRQFTTPGVQQFNINPTNLRRVLIAVPDTVEEQRAIVSRVGSVDSAIDHHGRERAKLSALREGLREDLLTGRKPVVAVREVAR